MREHIAWILVADAGRAKIYRHDGRGKGLALVEEIEPPASPAVEWGTDRPGRSFESVGSARHAHEPRRDPHDQAEDDFAREVCRRLDGAAKDGRFERLILVAAPRFLGMLRSHLGDHAGGRLIGTLDKDLVRAPEQQIANSLGHLLVP